MTGKKNIIIEVCTSDGHTVQVEANAIDLTRALCLCTENLTPQMTEVIEMGSIPSGATRGELGGICRL